MKRTALLFPALLMIGSALFARGETQGAARGAQGNAPANQVVIWTYDSFTSEWGPGPSARADFKEKTGIDIIWVNHGDAGEVLARLLLEGKNAGADLILGPAQNMAEKALSSGLLEAYKPGGAEAVFPELVIDPSYRLIPFDYSYFAICYDSDKIPSPPGSLEDLTRAEYRGKLILMDPRTSSPGLGFFSWTQAVYGENWPDYWRRLQPSILTIAEGWSSGYGLFTEGEAPLVSSYTTSPAYHIEYEETERFKAAIFTEGHPIQIETAGLLRAAKNKENAKKFLDYMLGGSFQKLIPLTNWMYPVIPVDLPESFAKSPKSGKPLFPAPPRETDLNRWAALFQK
ncbi:MAG: thiamine ABC transporter substrate-binding protein [Treponema sp.]|jgi:thiamine transport system substrate-binding protein|nr:thiamine ABC transporter substrate-binding protein [Treponema sp.]